MGIYIFKGRVDFVLGLPYLWYAKAWGWLTGENTIILARMCWLLSLMFCGCFATYAISGVGGPLRTLGVTVMVLMHISMCWNDRSSIAACRALHATAEQGAVNGRAATFLSGQRFQRLHCLVTWLLFSSIFGPFGIIWGAIFLWRMSTLRFSCIVLPPRQSAWQRAKSKLKELHLPRLVPAPSPA